MKRSMSMNVLFFLSLLLVGLVRAAQNRRVTNNVKIGVVVDYSKLGGRMGLNCIRMAISEFYESDDGRHYNTRLELHPRDSKSDDIGAASSALDLIKNSQVQAIIGPLTSAQAIFVIDLGEKANIPIISFLASSPSLNQQSHYFFRATQNEASQVKAIATIVQAFGWKKVVPIYSGDAYGEGLIPFLSDALLEANDAHVPYRCVLAPSVTTVDLRAELLRLMTMSVRVFVLHVNDLSLAKRIFAVAKEIGMMREGYVWIVTNVMTNLLSSSVDSKDGLSMNGVLGIRTYVPETNEVEGFRDRYRKKQFRDKEVNVFGLWAYDAAKALAIAVEEVWNSTSSANVKFGFTKEENGLRNNSTDLDTLGVSQSGPKLRQALSNVSFKGLAGNFSFVNGEVQVSAYEIINVVNGDLNKVVGYWTAKNGLIRNLNKTISEIGKDYYNTSKDNLSPITWPGQPEKSPKGWEIPVVGKKLKVGVPVRVGFKEFVDVQFNSDNTTTITGYCIDVFKAVIHALPYNVEYELIPYANSSHLMAGTYDELVHQVFDKKFDVVAGDVTIRWNRSQYVDFTLPYTESGVSMIVPLVNKRNKNAWVFMKPLTWDLWVTSACFFVFIGFVVWVLEHRINEEFRGPPSHQIGTSAWFAFSTMVFAHRERVISNLARFVIIIWVFVVVILTQSYTASLTAILTVQQLQPTITNVTELIINKENVGYLADSFVHGILISLGFNDSQLKIYSTPEQLDEAFSKYGTSQEDGIAAAFDENPYINLFLRRYCSKYTTVDPKFQADGFAFVFPIGSPLVPDVSRAILKVTEGDDLIKPIQKKWFGDKKNCPDTYPQFSANRLGLESFWGLFLVAGVSAIFALSIHVVIFFHGHWHTITSSSPAEASIWDRVRIAFRLFDQIDSSSHTFRRNTQMTETQGNCSSAHGVVRVEEIPQTSQGQPGISASSYSSPSDLNVTGCSSEQESSTTKDRKLEQVPSDGSHFTRAQSTETGQIGNS